MNDYFLLEGYVRPNDLFVRRYEDPHDYDDSYRKGEALPTHVTHSDATAVLYYDQGEKSDYISGIFSFPVVSSRFRELILAYEAEHAEFRPVSLLSTATGDLDTTYYFLHLLELVPSLDWERSIVETIEEAPQAVWGVKRLVLNSDQARHRHLFRMNEIKTLILVSATLRQQIERAQLTGIQFRDIAEYQT